MQEFARRKHGSKRPMFSIVGGVLALVCCLGVTSAFTPCRSALPFTRMDSSFVMLFVESRSDDGYDGLGEYDPSDKIRTGREVLVGDPQLRVVEKDRSVTSILRQLAAIQQQGPQKYCILGTRHCSYLHQQIIELLYVLFVLKHFGDTPLGHVCPRDLAQSGKLFSYFSCFVVVGDGFPTQCFFI